MAYSRANAASALSLIAGGTVAFEARAQLEHHLLTLLRRRGTKGVSAFLGSLPGHHFQQSDGLVPGETRFVEAGRDATRRLVVTTFIGPHSASVNVIVEREPAAATERDPRHKAFYEIWESMVGLADSEVESLDATRRAVFYVGLLEAEVMNGGLGQYLSNTGGVHVDATLRCLTEIGARRTASILVRAVQLGSSARSYTEAWDSNAEVYGRLDEELLGSGEDLAGLTADAFLKGGDANGSD